MDKESIYLLQCIDANCNDCRFFVRNVAALEASKQFHRDYCAWSYCVRRRYCWDEAQKALAKGNTKRHDEMMKQRKAVTVDTGYKTGLVFGNCAKFNKPISAVPNACQPDTQHCFEHRRAAQFP